MWLHGERIFQGKHRARAWREVMGSRDMKNTGSVFCGQALCLLCFLGNSVPQFMPHTSGCNLAAKFFCNVN